MDPETQKLIGQIAYVGLCGAVLLGLIAWLQYTIIWRAVRRGLKELRIEDHNAGLHYGNEPGAPPPPGHVRTDPAKPRHAKPGTGAPMREGPGPRDW